MMSASRIHARSIGDCSSGGMYTAWLAIVSSEPGGLVGLGEDRREGEVGAREGVRNSGVGSPTD